MEEKSENKNELEFLIARRPKCGICAYYPINVGKTYNCPVLGVTVTRLSAPPKVSGGRGLRFFCFQPFHELAYVQYKSFRYSRRQGRKTCTS